MTATKSPDMSVDILLKKEKDVVTSGEEDTEDNNDDNDNDSVSSLLQPFIEDKNNHSNLFDDKEDEFLRLNTTVRRVYFSYLCNSLIKNYNKCCKKNCELSENDLKKFASKLELNAVKCSLQSSVYRQVMLKIIADIKSNTSGNKIYKKLNFFLGKLPETVDVGIQTSQLDISDSKNFINDKNIPKNIDRIDEELREKFDGKKELNSFDDDKSFKNIKSEPRDDLKVADEPEIKIKKENKEFENTDLEDIFGDSTVAERIAIKDENENSKDSLMQNLEDMFFESEDSNDLTSLIEKHTSNNLSKNMESEISKFCHEKSENLLVKNSSPRVVPMVPLAPSKSTNQEVSENKKKISITSYKNMKKRALQGEDKKEDRQAKKIRGVWFVERIHQVAKLREKMTEISVKNYRKHGRLKVKFCALFGEDEAEEMMPESPIRIEEHLTECKERIAKWVVKYLMPFYRDKIIIQNKLLFKAVAKHIADMLILKNTFPEEETVSQYIGEYFRNKTCIATESDIYM